ALKGEHSPACATPHQTGKTAAHQEPWVEHVRVDKLFPHREWQHQPGGFSYTMDGDGPYAPKYDAESWEANKRSVAEEGVREPLTLKYNPTTHSAYLGEGNHRLHWARELGHQTVPVRMWRTSEEMPERYRRSEEHTSELQSRENLVCRLLLEKKKERDGLGPPVRDVDRVHLPSRPRRGRAG